MGIGKRVKAVQRQAAVNVLRVRISQDRMDHGDAAEGVRNAS